MKEEFQFLAADDLKGYGIELKLSETRAADEEHGLVPTYVFQIIREHDGVVLGDIQLRVGDSEGTFYGGHVRYHVLEEHRGNGYANKACLLLPKLAKRHGMKQLRMTCVPDHYAACRTCEMAGAVSQGVIDLPETEDLYRRGLRQVAVYTMDL